jgi:hypothetical protein
MTHSPFGMSTPEIIIRWATAYAVGALIAFGISFGVGTYSPAARTPVLVGLLLTWLWATVAGLRRWRADTTDSTTVHPQNRSEKSLLPTEFRFIGPNTTLQEIIDRIGPYDRIRDAMDGRNVQWDVPHGTMCVFLDGPVSPASPVARIRYLTGRDRDQF